MSKFRDVVHELVKDYTEKNCNQYTIETVYADCNAGTEFVLKALEEAIEQRNVWIRDYYLSIDCVNTAKLAIELEDAVLLDVLSGK